MKKLIFTGYFLFLFFGISAQESGSEKQFRLTHNQFTAGLSALEIRDPYLSMLNYTGVGFRIENLAERFFKGNDPHWSIYNRLSGIASLSANPTSTSYMVYMSGNAALGAQYHYREIKRLVLTAGANVDGTMGFRLAGRNINNEENFELATNLNLRVGVKYLIPTKRRTMVFRAQLESPLMGFMFVPMPGLSYYEMSFSDEFKKMILFSSFNNKQGLQQRYALDIPFKYSTWTFGFRSNVLKFTAHEQVNSYREDGFFVGFSYDLIRVGGRLRTWPDSFISPQFL